MIKEGGNTTTTTTTTTVTDSIIKPNQTTSFESVGAVSPKGVGRKTAKEVKAKLSGKEKVKAEKEAAALSAAAESAAAGKKKKKRRRKEETDAAAAADGGVGGQGGEDSDDGLNETEWVQCDSCGKWRVLPDNVTVSSLPNLWYCQMNMYDPKRRSCEAVEQTAKQALKDRKRARKRAKRMEQRVIEAEAQQQQQQQQQPPPEKESIATSTLSSSTTTTKKSKKHQLSAGTTTLSNTTSPRPQKAVKSLGKSKEPKTKETKPKDQHKTKDPKSKEQKEATTEAKKNEAKKKTPSSVSSSEEKQPPHPSDSGSDTGTHKEGKKKGKKGKQHKELGSEQTEAADTTATTTSNTTTSTSVDSKKTSRKRGRPANRSSNQTSADDKDEDNVEWVQCDKCEKWRKLPPDISADELPDIWNCTMNTWKPASASCSADEDKTDAQHHEVDEVGSACEWQLRQQHAGKYSFRQMIFGTGARKHNRPMSERSRAAESLFTQPPSIDEENPHPTTQYSKSSAFLPRMSNFQKANAAEEKATTLGIFDVLRNSQLWDELRQLEHTPPPAGKVLSSSSLSSSSNNLAAGNSSHHPQGTTYDSLSEDVKHTMQDVVLQILDFNVMTGEEVIGKAQLKSSSSVSSTIQGCCNVDIIIHTLLDLVRDGIVEMATLRTPLTPVSHWVPKYRRVRTNRAREAVAAIKASRCMKIAKPWKQRNNDSTTTPPTTEWITGGQS